MQAAVDRKFTLASTHARSVLQIREQLKPTFFCSNPGLAAKLEQERRLKEGISGHKTGLPKRLLELFSARPPLDSLTSIKHRKPKFAYNGIGQYVHLFPEPSDPEYEPVLDGHVEGERRFRNPELSTQAKVNQESKAEK